jgi:hypothetical protein
MLGIPARGLHLEGPILPGLLRRHVIFLVLAERRTPGEDIGAQMLAVFAARRDDVYSLLLRVRRMVELTKYILRPFLR